MVVITSISEKLYIWLNFERIMFWRKEPVVRVNNRDSLGKIQLEESLYGLELLEDKDGFNYMLIEVGESILEKKNSTINGRFNVQLAGNDNKILVLKPMLAYTLIKPWDGQDFRMKDYYKRKNINFGSPREIVAVSVAAGIGGIIQDLSSRGEEYGGWAKYLEADKQFPYRT